MELGSFVLSLSIISTGILLASFKLRTLLIVDTNWNFPIESYAMSRVIANSIIAILCMGLVSVFFPEIPLALFVCVLAYKTLDSISEFCHSYARRKNRFDFVTKIVALRSVTTIIAMGICGFLSLPLVVVLSAWIAVALLFVVFDILFVRSIIRKDRSDSFKLKTFVSLSALKDSVSIFVKYKTIAVSLVVSSLFVYLPNFMLSKLESVEMAGVFASISYFLVAGGIIINSLSQAATPTLAAFISNNAHKPFINLTLKLCAVGILLGILGLLVSIYFGRFFLELFYNAEVAAYSSTLNLVMFAALIRYVYIFIGTSFSALNEFNVQTNIYSIGLLVLAGASWYLIPEFGIQGVGWAMVIATIVELTLYLLSATKVFSLANISKQERGV